MKSISELPVLQITDQVGFLLTFWDTRYTVLSMCMRSKLELGIIIGYLGNLWLRQMSEVETF